MDVLCLLLEEFVEWGVFVLVNKHGTVYYYILDQGLSFHVFAAGHELRRNESQNFTLSGKFVEVFGTDVAVVYDLGVRELLGKG